MPRPHPRDGETDADIAAWAASGAMALTGPRDGPGLGPPAPLVARLGATAAVLARRSASLGCEVAVDPLVLLTERAAIGGLTRAGSVSCGGATRLLPTTDGRWVAVTLARGEDVDLLPAWLGVAVGPDPWPAVTTALAAASAAEVVDAGASLGLPVAALPDVVPSAPEAPPPLAPMPCRAHRVGDVGPVSALDDVVVVDLTSLWAGPLAGSLLAAAGAEVWKVESAHRPDGARRGPEPFFDLLNAHKRSVVLDLTSAPGRAQLAAIVAGADVVLEGSRPRALRQLGIDAEEVLAGGRPRVWASITGHGRSAPPEGIGRVGFGDDAAVAGGLVAWDGAAPCFCADAVADPATGLTAAAACLDALAVGGSWMLDLAMADVAAHLAGPTLAVPPTLVASDPVAREPMGSARPAGADTADVLDRVRSSS